MNTSKNAEGILEIKRIVGVRSAEQFVWHLLPTDLDYMDCSVVSDSAEVSGSLT